MANPWPGTPDFSPDHEKPRWWTEAEEDEELEFPDVGPGEVTVTENPVIAELLGPDGQVIRQWRERPPIGYR